MSLIHNERIKLLATFINGVGIAVFAVGGLAPMFSALYGTSGPSWFLVIMIVICVIIAGALHYVASTVLKRLKP